jgi:hypothetical protein
VRSRPRSRRRSRRRCRSRWRPRFRAVSPPGALLLAASSSAPDDHLTARPDRRVRASRRRSIHHVGGRPVVRVRRVSSANIETHATAGQPAPDDHFIAAGHGCVPCSTSRHATRTCRRTSVRAGIVSAPSVQIMIATIKKVSAPDDHFAAGPHCCVNQPTGGSIRCTRGCPTVGNWIIFPTRVQSSKSAAEAAPDWFLFC